MTMKFFATLLFVLFYSCCSNSAENYLTKEDLIRFISQNPSIHPPVFLFCKIGENQYGLIDSYGLEKNFNNYNASMDYKHFVENVMNNKIQLSCDDMYDCFQLNDTITFFYENNDWEVFLNKYSHNWSNDIYAVNDMYVKDKLSIFYYMFINNYFTSFDDISGFYSIGKIKASQLNNTQNW